MVEIIAKNVPADVLESLALEARRLNRPVTDLAGEILAERFRVARESSGRPYVEGAGVSDTLILTVPAALRQAIRRSAVERDATMRGLVIEALAVHFGHEAGPVGRRPRGR